MLPDSRPRKLASSILLALLLPAAPAPSQTTGDSAAAMPPMPEVFYGRYLAVFDPLHPRLKFNDSLVSMNDRCPVTSSKLNRRIQPVYVNGQAVGFC